MKHLFLVVAAAILLLPAISLAGSATSRWDVTIGGFVQADFGWADQGVGADYTYASRKSYINPATGVQNENRRDKYGATYMAAGGTRLSMAIKGPDGWGAKTSAYIEGQFDGAVGSVDTYGLFRLRHAFMRMDWGKWSLLFGQAWDNWGVIFPDLLGRNENVPVRRGMRAPQIRLTNVINQSWDWYIMLYQPNAAKQGSWNATADDFARSFMPQIAAELTYRTDKCGKIGKDQLLLAISGMIGQEKRTYKDPISAGTWSDDYVNSWGTAFKGFIPIIPEKKGDKSMSLFLKGQFLYGQNFRINTGTDAESYDADLTAVGADYVAPTAYAWYAQLGFYFTDKLWANLYYGQFKNNLSYRYMWAGGLNTTIRTLNQWSANLMYDVNPAVRLGVQYTYLGTGYAGYGTSNSDPCITSGVLGRSGSLNTARFAAWYFF